jgi:hypothetical protein
MLCNYIDQLEIRGMLGAYSKDDIAIAKSISVATALAHIRIPQNPSC